MDQDYFVQLIHTDLRGELTEDQASELAAWRTADAAHPAIEAQLRKGWELSQQYDPELAVDLPAAFNQLRTRVRAHEAQTQKALPAKVVPLYRRWWVVAASLVLILGAAWALWPGVAAEAPAMIVLEIGPNGADRMTALPDGTVAWLRPNSRLSYPATLPADERPFSLEGEAYFVVKKNAAAPFRVNTNGLTVEVLGTEFLVRAPKTGNIEVHVDEGKVAVSTARERLELTAGQSGRYNRDEQQLLPASLSPNTAGWHDNSLVFDRVPLQEVIADLETFGRVSITLDNPALANCSFSGRFKTAKQQDAWQNVLAAITDSFGTAIEEEGGSYTITGGICQ